MTRSPCLIGVSVLTGGGCVNAQRRISRGGDNVDLIVMEDRFKDRSCFLAQSIPESCNILFCICVLERLDNVALFRICWECFSISRITELDLVLKLTLRHCFVLVLLVE